VIVPIPRPCFAALALLLAIAVSTPCLAQAPGQAPQRLPNPGPPTPGQVTPPGPEDEARERIEKEMAKKANEERQAQLKRDTDRLLKLATELKTSVDKTDQNTLSLDVVKKAEEIEKLAHSVKEKMKGN
jgi:hypothetical protein